jgi:hypothetical protein
MHVGHVMAYSVKPICFERAFPISSNWNDTDGDQENIKRIVDEQRQCPSFRKWQQGFSPKEHAEMMQQEALLAWQDRQAASSRRHNNMTLAIAVTSTLIAAAVGAANFFKPNSPPIVNVTMPAIAPVQSIPPTTEPQPNSGAPMLLPIPNRPSPDPADPVPDKSATK